MSSSNFALTNECHLMANHVFYTLHVHCNKLNRFIKATFKSCSNILIMSISYMKIKIKIVFPVKNIHSINLNVT